MPLQLWSFNIEPLTKPNRSRKKVVKETRTESPKNFFIVNLHFTKFDKSEKALLYTAIMKLKNLTLFRLFWDITDYTCGSVTTLNFFKFFIASFLNIDITDATF